ncbi:hypothetical protein M2161_009123 [Streptomyces sp. SAI-133]|uniref:hypothetical protein n=1 Tax=unclassified Streptomyces TaxID=2593676 RepID=UPI002475C3FF|nr:hypothetical protein [Streptomyces sp. SAI-133]MDH6589932.1 hypothetical protein [Streptomyces sp. SAI-133]
MRQNDPQVGDSAAEPTPSAPQGAEAPLLDLRAAVILLLGSLVALIAGVLTWASHQPIPAAAFAAGGGFAGGVIFFAKIIH